MTGFEHHDHNACVSSALAAAQAHCDRAGAQFTPTRRRVLEILLEGHRAMGAYDILNVLRAEGLGSQPPVAYRALDFLVTHGLVHKIEQKNAFIACAHPGEAHAPAFLICRACDRVLETRADPGAGALADTARSAGFAIETTVQEARGICPDCRDDASGQTGA